MRVATLLKRLLRLGRDRVVGVELEVEDGIERMIVEVAPRPRRELPRVRDPHGSRALGAARGRSRPTSR